MFNYYSGHSGHESKLPKLFFFSFIVSWIETVLVSIGDLSRNVEFVQISQFSEAVWLSHISWDLLFDSPVSISGLVRDLACVPKSRVSWPKFLQIFISHNYRLGLYKSSGKFIIGSSLLDMNSLQKLSCHF